METGEREAKITWPKTDRNQKWVTGSGGWDGGRNHIETGACFVNNICPFDWCSLLCHKNHWNVLQVLIERANELAMLIKFNSLCNAPCIRLAHTHKHTHGANSSSCAHTMFVFYGRKFIVVRCGRGVREEYAARWRDAPDIGQTINIVYAAVLVFYNTHMYVAFCLCLWGCVCDHRTVLWHVLSLAKH